MLIDITQFDLDIRGVLHIGAFIGEEMVVYEYLGIQNVIFFEPVDYIFRKLCENVRGKAQTFKFALGNHTGSAVMNVSQTITPGRPWFQCGCGASSSLLQPNKHLQQHPNVKFPHQETVEVRKLDDVVEYFKIPMANFNMINIDVQGYELEVFKGAIETLNHIDYVMSEVNRDEVYTECARVEEIDEFLGEYGFVRTTTNWAGDIWGDALYVKDKK